MTGALGRFLLSGGLIGTSGRTRFRGTQPGGKRRLSLSFIASSPILLLAIEAYPNDHSMGNRGSNSTEFRTERQKILEQLETFSPIKLCYKCHHGKCKRVVDMKVIRSKHGKCDFLLGTSRNDGGFVQSHFVKSNWGWEQRTLFIQGSTPNGFATIEIESIENRYLRGKIDYKAYKQGARRVLQIHAHLDTPRSNHNISSIGTTRPIQKGSGVSLEA
jgi:hypothetical protein